MSNTIENLHFRLWETDLDVFDAFVQQAKKIGSIDIYEELKDLISDVQSEDILVFYFDKEIKQIDKAIKKIRKRKVDVRILIIYSEKVAPKISKHQQSKLSADIYLNLPLSIELLSSMLGLETHLIDQEIIEDTAQEIEVEEFKVPDLPPMPELNINENNNIDEIPEVEDVEVEIEMSSDKDLMDKDVDDLEQDLSLDELSIEQTSDVELDDLDLDAFSSPENDGQINQEEDFELSLGDDQLTDAAISLSEDEPDDLMDLSSEDEPLDLGQDLEISADDIDFNIDLSSNGEVPSDEAIIDEESLDIGFEIEEGQELSLDEQSFDLTDSVDDNPLELSSLEEEDPTLDLDEDDIQEADIDLSTELEEGLDLSFEDQGGIEENSDEHLLEPAASNELDLEFSDSPGEIEDLFSDQNDLDDSNDSDQQEDVSASDELEFSADDLPVSPVQGEEFQFESPAASETISDDLSEDAMAKLAEIDQMLQEDATSASFSREGLDAIETEDEDYDPTASQDIKELEVDDKMEATRKINPTIEPQRFNKADEQQSEVYNEEIIRLSETISMLKKDRQSLIEKINEHDKNEQRIQSEEGFLRAQFDEKKIELSVTKKRYETKVGQLEKEADILSEKNSLYIDKIKRLEHENQMLQKDKNFDLASIRNREKDLESQLELLKADTSAQITNRDQKILQLKRRVDTLEFDLEAVQLREKRISDDQYAIEDRMEKVINTLRGAIGNLEEDSGLNIGKMKGPKKDINF